MQELDKHVKDLVGERLEKIEEHFEADCIFYYGPIVPSIKSTFRDFVELLRQDDDKRKRLIIILNSPGGSVETVEKMVEIIRHHYEEVYFIVPDEAMSVGTIFCMSGDKIYMDYSSSLGPIDPQIFNGKDLVPALGYLDRFEKMVEKSRNGELTDAEFILMQNQDLAMLNQYEQAKNLTITLLKKWLVEYKFKNWTVTEKEKKERAEKIASMLSDNKKWHSHGRKIGLKTLSGDLRLKIEDYSDDRKLQTMIRSYSDFLVEYIMRHNIPLFLHNRKHF